jgi:REP element-mobilizing transposase RayT
LRESHQRQLVDCSSPAYSSLFLLPVGFTLCRMQLTPFTTLHWACQLHYYICFRTHRRRAWFAEARNAETLTGALTEICQRHDYHLLESKVYPDHLRCLLSLRPEQTISTMVQTLKANASRECNRQLGLSAPLWARGYFARGVGRVPLSVVKQYLFQQAEHHGYDKRARPPVFRYRAEAPAPLSVAHAAFELNHHLVFATRYRRGVFGAALGKTLADYWLQVAEKRGFAIDQLTIVPDHVHLLVRLTPKMSIAACVMALLNNGQYYIGKHQPQALIEAGVDQLWQASAYAGTRGAYTTALIKHWLGEPE